MSDESNDLLGEHALDELGDTMRNQGPPTDRQKVQPRTVDVDDLEDQRREATTDAGYDEHGPPTPPVDDTHDGHFVSAEQEQRAEEILGALWPIMTNASSLAGGAVINQTDGDELAVQLADDLASRGFGIACRECSELHRALAELVHTGGRLRLSDVNHGQEGMSRRTAWLDAHKNAKKLLDNQHAKT